MPHATGSTETGDWSPEMFRAELHRVADWIADYRAHIETLPVAPRTQPGEIAAALPREPPPRGEPLEHILTDFDRLIVPGLVHWGHPSFLGYFGSTTTAPGVIGEMLMAALNVSAMTWATSPAATELEVVVLDWLKSLVGLPAEFTGIVYDTASIAVAHALAAAREIAVDGARQRGLSGAPPLRIYVSDQAHSSAEKAAIMLGIGEENVVRVTSDNLFRMDAAALDAAIRTDLRCGFRPLAVIATVGTTSTTSVDPVPQIADLCQAHSVWLHVDAAYGAALATLPAGGWVMEGVALADSLVINPHKWFFVPLDFSALYTRRPEVLRQVFALTPEYLRGDASRADRNFMDYGLQLGRRFRALKAWVVWRSFGREGLTARIGEHCRLAQQFTAWVEADADFKLAAPTPMAVVCFRAQPAACGDDEAALDKLNERIVAAVNASGQAYLTHTRLRGRSVMRLAIGNVLTEERHLEQAWRLIREQLAVLQTPLL